MCSQKIQDMDVSGINVIMSEELDCVLTHVCKKSAYDNMQIVDRIKSWESSLSIGKPYGMWLSVNHSWEEWCTSQMPEWYTDEHVSALARLPSGLRFMSITSAPDAALFIKHFASRYMQRDACPPDWVEWDRVYSLYDGVYFTDNWDTWLDRSGMFSSWDVDCLCLFRAKQAGLKFTGYEESGYVKTVTAI